MRLAYFDCISGISGDMTLGALIDAGASLEGVQQAVRSLGLEQVEITASEVKKCGFRAKQIHIGHPPEHAHRHLHEIREMLDRGRLAPEARALADRIFVRLAEAEARVHGTTPEKVHFHEVGAVDSIADIVGTAVAFTELGIEGFAASRVPTGTGSIEIAHGRVGIPAPATAELLRGIPIAESEIEAELTTPTGAAILSAVCNRFGPIPPMTVEAVGYGAGTRDLAGQANVLRLLVGTGEEVAAYGPVESDHVWVLETNVDDATGEELAACVESVWQAGAIDVYQTPTVMKKGRSGVLLTVLAGSSAVPAVERALFQQAGTIGIRRWQAQRHKLIRRPHTVETPLGPVVGKCVWMPEGRWRFAPEHDDVAATAADRCVPFREVFLAAELAFAQSEPPAPPADSE